MNLIEGEEPIVKQTWHGTNYFSDHITIVIQRRLADGTYLVHEHTDCCKSYKEDHPDRYRVMSLSDLEDFEAKTIGGDGELNHQQYPPQVRAPASLAAELRKDK